jgi:hypothetical protein
MECASFADRTLGPNPSTMRFDYVACYRQAQTGTFPVCPARLPEAVECMRQLIRGHSRALVSHRHHDFSVYSRGAQPNRPSLKKATRCDSLMQMIASAEIMVIPASTASVIESGTAWTSSQRRR